MYTISVQLKESANQSSQAANQVADSVSQVASGMARGQQATTKSQSFFLNKVNVWASQYKHSFSGSKH